MTYIEKRDFDFLELLINDFFNGKNIKSKRIREKLRILSGKNKNSEHISGWEIWLQIELYFYFQQNDQIQSIKREIPFDLDKRYSYTKSTNGSYCAIDILIQRKNTKSPYKWIPLEIKRASTAGHCIRNMFQDLQKFNSIKSRTQRSNDAKMRNPFFLGIFRSYAANNKDNILKRFKQHNSTLECKIIEVKNTSYSVILF